MRAIIGLGNPGWEYDGTRHNIGFAVVDAVAEQCNIRFQEGSGEFWIAAPARYPEIVLVKPVTYMNNSGIAVREVLELLAISVRDLLVVVDDFYLPLGTLRLRLEGSSAGHNGLASIIWHLQSEKFPRLRCGIDGDEKPKEKRDRAEFVLSRFSKEEREHVHTMVLQARDAVIVAAQDGLHAAMNYVSRQQL